MEDSAIIGLYWARDEEAISASDQKYGNLCRSLSQNILGSREDAEECVNDTWKRAWDTMPPQRPNSLRAYLAKITRNLSIDRWRAKRAEKRGGGLDILLDELDGCLPAYPSAEEVTEARETTRAIDRWLSQLSPADRIVFLRRYWYGQRDLNGIYTYIAQTFLEPETAFALIEKIEQEILSLDQMPYR